MSQHGSANVAALIASSVVSILSLDVTTLIPDVTTLSRCRNILQPDVANKDLGAC